MKIFVKGIDLKNCGEIKIDLPKIKMTKTKSKTFLIPANKKNTDLNLSKELIKKLLK